MKTKIVPDPKWQELQNHLQNGKQLKNEQNINDAALSYNQMIKMIPDSIHGNTRKFFEKIFKYEELLRELSQGTEFQGNRFAQTVMQNIIFTH